MEIIIPTQMTHCGETLTTFLSQLAQNVDGKVTNTELPTSQVQPEEESRSNGFGGERMLRAQNCSSSKSGTKNTLQVLPRSSPPSDTDQNHPARSHFPHQFPE